ncbi:nuclear transport factor 2 family protein [Euzebya rosea]|uniref:nuclear transport factor 2 family protein n=1 Tax=Euzebya rosea TaxID=2052804 RepID=UPI000D3E85F6|nr:nuclear transport factor 2 family protein [Euzebya rosea]
MGRAREHWEQLRAALEKVDVETVGELYAPDAVWLEPQNPPHETNKLIQAYLSSWMQARENIDVSTKRILESEDGSFAAIEWAISYTAAGRRWNSLPRSSWIEVSDQGIAYQRDYY